MAQAFLIFDFSANEETAQQARHRIEAWKQGSRLGKKLELKFERNESDRTEPEEANDAGAKPASKKPDSKKQGAAEQPAIHLIIRLDFSDHEKLSFQRWLQLIPSEEPFAAAKPKVVRSGDPEFKDTAERFSSLDHQARNEKSGLKT